MFFFSFMEKFVVFSIITEIKLIISTIFCVNVPYIQQASFKTTYIKSPYIVGNEIMILKLPVICILTIKIIFCILHLQFISRNICKMHLSSAVKLLASLIKKRKKDTLVTGRRKKNWNF